MPDEIAGAVKDLAFGVNTMTSGKTTFITEPINGSLEGIFINTIQAVSVDVRLGNSNIKVFSVQSIVGEEFIPVRIGVVDVDGASFRDTAEKWSINDVLVFNVKGPFNTAVNFKVRYC